jgi:ribonuclease D
LNDVKEYKNTAASVKKLCLSVAEKNEIPPELVGSKKQINQLLKWCWFKEDETREMGLKPDLLSNWRRALLVNDLVKIDTLNLSDELAEGNL